MKSFVVLLVSFYVPLVFGYSTGLIKPDHELSVPYLKFPLSSPADSDLPDHVDNRSLLTPIRDQGQCGSCWAFSTTASVENSQDMSMDLSEQQVVDCDTKSYGCGGGYFTGFDVAVNPGLGLEKDYPYRARNGRCHSVRASASIHGYQMLGDRGREPTTEEIMRAVVEFKIVSVTIAADGNFMNYGGRSGDHEPVFTQCSMGQTNHMINIVGYDKKDQYWIIRNSWGTRWGVEGYGKIKFTDRRGNKCNRIGEEAAVVSK